MVLDRNCCDQYENVEDVSVAYNTRGRRNSKLTADNLAALSSKSTGKKSTAARSVKSDDTTTTNSRRTSSRLASIQNTPKKDVVTAPARRGCK